MPLTAKRRFADANFLAHRILMRKYAFRQFLGEQADLGVAHHVIRVKIASAKDDQASNLLEVVGNSDQFYGPLDADGNNTHRDVRRSRSHRNFRDLGPHRFHVAERNLVAQC